MAKRTEIKRAKVLELAGLIERGLTTEQACHYLKISPAIVSSRVNHPKNEDDEFLRDEILSARAADLLRVHDILMERGTEFATDKQGNPVIGKDGKPVRARLETAQVKACLGRLFGLDHRFKRSALEGVGNVVVNISLPRPGDAPMVGGGIQVSQAKGIAEGAVKSLEGGSDD